MTTPHAARLRTVRDRLAADGDAAAIVGPGPDLRWTTGFALRPSERPTLLVVPADGHPTLVTPGFEVPIAERSGVADLAALRGWADGDDPFTDVLDLLPDTGAVAVGSGVDASWLLALQHRRPRLAWHAATSAVAVPRMTKDAREVAALHAAGAAIDAVHAEVADLLAPGRSEDDVAADLRERIAADHDAVGFVIVGSGANGAIPHHDHGPRTLAPGDAVVVDIGGPRRGYWSDCTRTYVVGGPDAAAAEVRRVADVVLAAQQAGVAHARPGVTAASVDAATRAVVAAAGLGEWFTHRTGHGIGLEGHEAPYLVRGDDTVLAPGMAFSVEPGVYLPGRFGVRIEDIVVVTDDGVETCNARPRGLA